MAVEGPLLATTLFTASANLSSTASLAGPNGSGQFLLMKISGSGTVTVTAASTDITIGVLQNDPASGFGAEVAVGGVSKVVSGAAVTAGALLMPDTSGRAITLTGTNPSAGVALTTSTAANQIISMLVVPVSNY